MDLEHRLNLQKEIDELEDRQHAAARAGDHKTAHELGLKIIGRLEQIIAMLER